MMKDHVQHAHAIIPIVACSDLKRTDKLKTVICLTEHMSNMSLEVF